MIGKMKGVAFIVVRKSVSCYRSMSVQKCAMIYLIASEQNKNLIKPLKH